MPICIIGMHRTGTSMVARLLNLCGLDLGHPERLLGPDEGNALGHFENIGFLEINEKLLAHHNGAWDDPPSLQDGWERDPSLEPLAREARSLIASFTDSPHWGWKDPRTTILLPFWRSLVPELKFVVCLRSPLEVAKSLNARNAIPIDQGAYLWNHYMRAAIRNTEGVDRLFTFYEDFFTDPPDEIDRLVGFCGLRTPDDRSSLDDAISGEARHHATTAVDVLADDKIAREYRLFHMALRGVSAEREVTSIGV